MKASEKTQWIKWLKSELSDYDKRHSLNKYQVMADLPPGEAYDTQIKAKDGIVFTKIVMSHMLSFLSGDTTLQEAKRQAKFAISTPEYKNASKTVQYVYDSFVKVTS